LIKASVALLLGVFNKQRAVPQQSTKYQAQQSAYEQFMQGSYMGDTRNTSTLQHTSNEKQAIINDELERYLTSVERAGFCTPKSNPKEPSAFHKKYITNETREYWCSAETRRDFPYLSQIGLKLRGMKPSSAFIERYWSQCGLICDAHNANMSPAIIITRSMLRAHMDILRKAT
jgi:hypothetical protein